LMRIDAIPQLHHHPSPIPGVRDKFRAAEGPGRFGGAEPLQAL